MKKIILIVVSVLILIILLLVIFNYFKDNIFEEKQGQNSYFFEKPLITDTQVSEEKFDDGKSDGDNNDEQDVIKGQELPPSVNLEMVFIPQAPFANWDELHEEACEEASILLTHYYLLGIKSISREKADEEITKMVEWQVENYGDHYDLTAEQTSQFVKDYYGYKNVQVYDDITIDDIKTQLANGNPVIVPAAGRKLGNPYFRQPGPIYHMLVVKGYDSKNFVTNDVGTKRGENYKYPQDILYNAIHDFVGKSEEEMETGKKAMIVVKN